VIVSLWQTVREKKIELEYLHRDFPNEELVTAATSQLHILQEDSVKATAVMSARNHQRVDFSEGY
jgi:hypothetical protein